MTWQRIDDDTYIDNTLVTCAEYQLFIDEMREQGKFYQPDHWTSLQFPLGQGRKPIFGARYSDVLAFCEWLIQRYDGEWNYRLPSEEEAVNHQIVRCDQEVCGYWINEDLGSKVSDFVWCNNITPIFQSAIKDHAISALQRIGQNINLSDASRLSQSTENLFPLDMDKVYEKAKSLRDNHVLSLDIMIGKLLGRNLNRSERLNSVSHPAVNVLLNVTKVDTTSILRRSLEIARNSTSERSIASAMEIFISILALQERREDRLKAFEGVRIVREPKGTEHPRRRKKFTVTVNGIVTHDGYLS